MEPWKCRNCLSDKLFTIAKSLCIARVLRHFVPVPHEICVMSCGHGKIALTETIFNCDATKIQWERNPEYLSYCLSLSSKISPHSGQNLGGWCGSGGSQPHLSHLNSGAPSGFLLPHSAQNLPLFTAPQLQVQPSSAGLSSGFLLPQLAQNLPVLVVPQLQVQASAAGAAAAGAAGAAGGGVGGCGCCG